MTDAPAPRQPSGETLPPAEDETRFAPKENGGEHKDENSAPAAKKRLKTSLDVVSEHAAEEESARQEDSERKARGDALGTSAWGCSPLSSSVPAILFMKNFPSFQTLSKMLGKLWRTIMPSC